VGTASVFQPRTLRDVERQITPRLLASADGGLGSLREALAPFRSRPAIARLLETLLADGAALEQIAARSYLHVNGFDKLVLHSAGAPEWELRLHVWWAEATSTEEHGGAFRSHNHRWDYSSYLIDGGLSIRHFEVTEVASGQELFLYRYLPPGRGTEYSMQPLGKGRLSCVFEGFLRAGDHYSLSHQVQHTVRALAGRITASLVLRGPAVRPDTLVFAEAEVAEPDSIPVTRLDAGEVASRLRRLLAHLARPEGRESQPG
jgi:hypothetical protein